MLYQLGALQFDVAAFNMDEVTHDYGADFAAKDLVGAAKSREFMGPADEKLSFRGTLFPLKPGFGGLDHLGILSEMVASGDPQILVRGDGANLGWWLIDKASEKSSKLSSAGVGKVLAYEISLVRSAHAAQPASLLLTFFRLLA
jgi:phage protein U